MPAFTPDPCWSPGAVRIRAKAFDPFAGLRGRAYIAARQLDQNRVKRLDSKATAEAQSISRKKQEKALAGPAPTQPRHLNFVFIPSGSIEQAIGLPPNEEDHKERRFWVVPLDTESKP
jgi:hypothetical protein